MTTAAAPSPKRPLATRLAIDVSSRCTVRLAQLDREQHGDVVRVADEVVVHPGDPGRAGDAAEPDERHPLDVRRAGRSRAATRASSDGTASPVIVVDTIESTSAG